MSVLKAFIQIFGATGAIFTICLGIPQLIHLRRRKVAENINYYSFWIFFIGIIIWIIYGIFTPNENGWYVFIANLVCAYIFSFTIYYAYKYNPKIKGNELKTVFWSIIIANLLITAFLFVFIVLCIQKVKTGLFYPPKNQSLIAYFDKTTALIIGFFTPSLTALAFLPQLIRGLVKKQFHGISPWMPFLFVLNSLSWLLYFVLNIAYASNKATINAMIGGIVWQTLAIILYATQFGFILHYEIKNNHHHKSRRTAIKNA